MSVPKKELHRVVPAVIIYNSEGKFLIVKRSSRLKIFPGKWHVPGGGLSMDDYMNLPSSSPKQKQWYYVIERALRREVREEVGLEIGKPTYLLDVAFILPNGVPVIVLTYYAKYASGKFKSSEESVEMAWVSASEAKKYDLIEGIAGEIEMVDAILKAKKS
ncbi:MAG: NUDIX domain-containing protein [Candidatus Taylorbacteria bacterium]